MPADDEPLAQDRNSEPRCLVALLNQPPRLKLRSENDER